MIAKSIARLWLLPSILALTLIVSACSDSGSNVRVGPEGDASISIVPPAFLQIRAIEPENLRLKVFINDDEVTMLNQGGSWTGSTTADKNSSVTLKVEWTVIVDTGEVLLLATAFNRQDNITTGIDFSVTDDGYVSTGPDFDFDRDGISNLEELRRDRKPLVADVPTDAIEADVNIFPTGLTTKIDGRQLENETYWSFATYEDTNKEKLAINNMIRDDSVGIEEDPNPDYQWAALHDEEYLTLYVWGKRRNGSTILVNGDSPGNLYFNDDSLEIYLDGDLSQGREQYDKVDDLLINIPLARGVAPMLSENNSSAADKRIYRGNSVQNDVVFDVQDPNSIEFATCFCGGIERATWEVRINLAAAKIPINKTFGFELQINRDDDGGQRDSKWAWAKPARGPGQSNDDSDTTWRFPVHMGKAKLISFPN